MSNVVEWKTATEIMEYLAQQNQLVSGMSVAQAAAALGFTQTASGIYVKTIVTTAVKSIAGTTATAVAAEVATGATTTATNVVLYETASGTAAVGGLASVALPIATSMLAATGGYLIGNEIYKQNSDFLDRLMFPVYDFITGNNATSTLYGEPNVPTIPMIFDANGNTFMDSRAQNLILDYLNEQSLLPKINQIKNPLSSGFIAPIFKMPISSGQTIKCFNYFISGSEKYKSIKMLNGTADLIFSISENTQRDYNIALISKTPFSCQVISHLSNTEYNSVMMNTLGNVWYLYYQTASFSVDKGLVTNFTPVTSYTYVPTTKSEEMYNILIAENITISGMPDEVAVYVPGTSPAPLEFPDNVPSWIPVVVPRTVPEVMPEPEPVPDSDPDPEKITPFIIPEQPQPIDVPVKKPVIPFIPSFPIVPVPNVKPDTSTAPSPEPDPSTDPSQLPVIDPVIPQVPINIPDGAIDDGGVIGGGLPSIGDLSSSATGLLHVYNPTDAQINQFGAWLWTTFSGDLIETLSKLFNNPMDAVIGLHELYCTPTTATSGTIKAGFLDSGVASRLVTTRYNEIKCGALSVPEFWGNYLDYSPYTKSYCYLPFIGIVELNSDDIIGSGVEITYKVDTYNGSCIALITTAKPNSAECVTYEFSGNCAVEVPITSGMKSAMQSALIGAITTGFAASTGGTGAIAAAAVGGVRQGANSKNSVQHSGSFGSSYGAMGIKIPFLIIKRPKQKVVAGYNDNYGYPAHKMVRIGDCSGYLKAIEVDVVSPTATEDEKRLIEKQLKDGIFVN